MMAELTPEQETHAMYDELLGGRMPTPEALAFAEEHGHTVRCEVTLAELLDRFAAQRGAEAAVVRLVHLFAQVIVEGEGAFTGGAWEAALCEAERINRGAPSQTGGGDAGERAREHASAVLYRVIEHHLAKTGEWADEDLDALRAGLAMLDSREADLRSSHREAMEAPFTKALVAEARTQGYREGAEAMREACAAWHDDKAQYSLAGDTHERSAAHHRALPIPGKTDAG